MQLHLLVLLGVLFAAQSHAQMALTPNEKALHTYAEQVLAKAGQDCKFARGTAKQDGGVLLVDCVSNDGVHDVQYELKPQVEGDDRITQLSRTPTKALPPLMDNPNTDLKRTECRQVLQAGRFGTIYRTVCPLRLQVPTPPKLSDIPFEPKPPFGAPTSTPPTSIP